MEQTAALDEDKTNRGQRSYNSSRVTTIFAHATLIYLHVVVSGWNTDLIELQESVARVIHFLKSLPDQGQLSNLAWPLCIAGCVARKEDEEFFRSMVMRASSDVLYVGNIWNAFQIMETCWSKRNELMALPGGTEWTHVMTSLGHGLVLA